MLLELDELLEKHGDLEAGAGFLSRMKWAPRNGPLRMRLLVRTNFVIFQQRNDVPWPHSFTGSLQLTYNA